MIQLKEEVIEDIINCDDPKLVEFYIIVEIIMMRQQGYMDFRIMRFIQKLDLTLVTLQKQEPSLERSTNIQYARKILLNKILHGIDA